MKLKQLLAAMLCVCLMFGFAVPAFAASKPDVVYEGSAAEDELVPFSSDLLDAMDFDLQLEAASRISSLIGTLQSAAGRLLLPNCFAIGSNSVSNCRQLAAMDVACSAPGNAGSIGIVPAELNGKPVTLIVLGGTMPGRGQANGNHEDALSAMELPNAYLRNVVRLFAAKDANGSPIIPKDKPVVVSGLSLGGMIAQQLLSQKKITDEFDITAVLCFGAPLIAPDSRSENTRVVRFADTSDLVPLMGKSKILDMLGQKLLGMKPSKMVAEMDAKELVLEDGGFSNTINAHTQSYVMARCWKDYDIFGVKNGTNELVIEEDVQYFANPRKQP